MFEGSQFSQTGTSDKGAQAGKKATPSTQGEPSPVGVDLMVNYNLYFFVRKEKTDKVKNLVPLYLRISCDKRVEISLGKSVAPSKWNAQKQCVVGNSDEAKAINAFLKTVEVKFHEIHRQLMDRGDLLSADILKTRFLGKGESQKTILQAFDYHLTQITAKLGKGYSIATQRKYEYLRNHISNYLQKTTDAIDLVLSRVDLYLIKDFQTYLMTDRQIRNGGGEFVTHKGCDFNAALKYVKMLRTIVNIALSFRWIDIDPFAGFKEKFQDVDQEYLTEVELRQVMNKAISIERLSTIRDIFVFCCFTGLAYSDVAKLGREHIVVGMDGRKMIDLKRTKTNSDCKIPLLPVPESILTKYRDHPVCITSGRLLPVCSNQKYNAYLKEIADVCGIEKTLTSHVARRTFATVAAELGVPAETIVMVIGHRGFRHLHLYSKPGHAKLSKDMEAFTNKDWGTNYQTVHPKPVITNAS
jgi:integrase